MIFPINSKKNFNVIFYSKNLSYYEHYLLSAFYGAMICFNPIEPHHTVFTLERNKEEMSRNKRIYTIFGHFRDFFLFNILTIF